MYIYIEYNLRSRVANAVYLLVVINKNLTRKNKFHTFYDVFYNTRIEKHSNDDDKNY